MATFPTQGERPWDAELQAYIDAAGGGGSGVTLAASNGTDDASAINAILGSGLVKVIRGRAGESYIIGSPLIVRSGTVLDMTGATITLKASSNCNMIQNRAVATVQRTITDGAITSGSNLFNSPSQASFTTADQGRTIMIPGAATNGGTLCAKIVTRNSATQVVISQTATLTVSGQTVPFYDRDSSIILRGLNLDRGANGGSTGNAHSVYIRRCDSLVIDDFSHTSTAGKFGISVGDIAGYAVRDVYCPSTFSDTVHITGPAVDGMVENVETVSGGDDIVALTTSDSAGFDDCRGTIDNLTIRNVAGSNLTRVVLLAGSATASADGYLVQNVTVERVRQYGAGDGVYLGAQVAGSAMTHDGITIRGVRGARVYLRAPYMGQIVVEDVLAPPGAPAVHLTPEAAPQNANIIDRLTLRNCRAQSSTASTTVFSASNAVSVIGQLDFEDCSSSAPRFLDFSNASVNTVRLNGCEITTSLDAIALGATTIGQMVFNGLRGNLPTTGTHFVKVNSGTVNQIDFNDPQVTAVDNTSGSLVFMNSTSAVCTKVNVNGGRLDATRGVLDHKATGTGVVAYLNVSGTHFQACNRIVQAGAATLNVSYANITQASPVNAPVFVSGGAVNVRGSGWQSSASTSAVQRAGSEVIHVIAQDFPADASILTGANGDTFTNTNSAVAPYALGPCVRDAANANWRPEQGFMASGTATLVAGTVTVSDTKITANSVIRLHTRTVGGTQGALFISALTAATSFAIKSTSATDTSVVYYEVVTY